MRRRNLRNLGSRENQSSRAVSARRRWWRRMVLVGILLVAGSVSYHLFPQALAGWTTIHHVSISGVKLMKRGEILSLLNLPPESSLWNINPVDLQERLQAHPRISSASVGRALPHTLAVVIREREPVAAFQHAGGQLYLDQDGVVLSIASDEDTSRLPVFSGLSAIRVLEGEPSTRDRARLGVTVAKHLRERFEGQVHIDFRDPDEVVATTEDAAFRVNQDFKHAWDHYLALESTIHASLPTEPYEIDLRYADKVIVRQRG